MFQIHGPDFHVLSGGSWLGPDRHASIMLRIIRYSKSIRIKDNGVVVFVLFFSITVQILPQKEEKKRRKKRRKKRKEKSTIKKKKRKKICFWIT